MQNKLVQSSSVTTAEQAQLEQAQCSVTRTVPLTTVSAWTADLPVLHTDWGFPPDFCPRVSI